MRLFICLAFIFLIACNFNFAQDTDNGKVDTYLLEQYKSQEINNFIIVLSNQLILDPGSISGTKPEKAEIVFNRLKKHAQTNQSEVTSFLKDEGIEYKSYFIVNAIWAKAPITIVRKLEKIGIVDKIISDPFIRQILPPEDLLSENKTPGDVEWGLMRIGVEYAWELGYKGSGVVVAGQDTGYDWTHSAIKEKYRGWVNGKANHNYNWHDAINEISPLHNDSIIDPGNNPCGLSVNIPCDDHGHGTHTMGTMIGENENNKIGVAPEASWIGCRNMERGYGKPSTYIECFEWFLAPTDTLNQNPDPALAPHVVNNSWSCPEMEGCNSDNWSLMKTAVNNLRASGVVVVVSAGNRGPNCSTVNSPAAMFESSLTVGALGQNDSIAPFSSRGPVAVDQSFRIKPDIIAPGVKVRSSFPGDQYRTWNGTSMAGPHVAGLVALIISANPKIAGDVEAIEGIIKTSADALFENVDCDNFSALSSPNYIYGYGLINVKKAIIKALSYDDDIQNEGISETIIYPNPGSTQIYIETRAIFGSSQFSIHDISGKILKIIDLDLDYYHRFRMNISDLQQGIYYYLLRQNNKVIHTGKLVKY